MTSALACRCEGRGYTLDKRCAEGKCDHRIRPPIERNEKGNVTKRGPRIMECPPRPCRCPFGTVHRAALRKMIRKQRRRIEKQTIRYGL